jgi:hypothetical protein
MPPDEFFEMLSKPQIIGLVPSTKKERKGKLDPDKGRLPGWSAATFVGDRRKKDACEKVTALVLDYDGGATIDEAELLWGKYFGLLHTTPSHRHDGQGDRFRVILPFDRPVTPAEYAQIWLWAKAECEAAGHEIDEAPKDPSRFWFMPAVVSP